MQIEIALQVQAHRIAEPGLLAPIQMLANGRLIGEDILGLCAGDYVFPRARGQTQADLLRAAPQGHGHRHLSMA